MERKRVCGLIRTNAEEYLQTYGGDFSGDYRDLKGVADILELGYAQQAYAIASNLDTIVREYIPDAFWTMEK